MNDGLVDVIVHDEGRSHVPHPQVQLVVAFNRQDTDIFVLLETLFGIAQFAALDESSAEARRFVTLEDWANEGEPLPLPAARELIEDFFGSDLPGKGEWKVGGRAITDALDVPLVNFTASHDRITPSATAASGSREEIAAGHVGMVVGSARRELHQGIAAFLDPACR